MAGNLANGAELLVLDWLNGVGTPARPTLPLLIRLMTANGDDATLGTEVVGGSYTPQPVTMSAAGSGLAANTNTVTFPLMPATTVVGVEVWDSLAVRVWWGPLAEDTTTVSGDSFIFDPGDVVMSLG